MKNLKRSLGSCGMALAAWLALGVAGDAAPLRQSAVPSGLVGYWKLDEGSGNVAGDSSGAGHHGALMGGTQWIQGRFGNALGFDGATGFVRIPRQESLESSAISISVWMVAAAPPSTWANIVRKAWRNDSAPSYTSWGLQLNPAGSDPSVVAFNTGYAGGLDVLSSPLGTIVPGRVTHLVAVYQPGRKQLYVNGALVASNMSAVPILYDDGSTGDLYFGQSGAPGEFFQGGIDEVQIYNRALSAEEAQFLSNPVAPGAPVGVVARTGDSRIVLDWSPPSGSFPMSYMILRSTSPTDPATPIASGVTGTTYTDKPLENLTTYYYRIQSVNPAGQSDPSDPVSAMPTPGSSSVSRNERCGCASVSKTTGLGLVALGTAGIVILFPRRRRLAGGQKRIRESRAD